jgi:TPR repeat protein
MTTSKYQETFEVCKKAAQQGDADAQNNLGWMYEKGLGVEQDYKETMDWHKKAEQQGHPEAKAALTKLIKILESK